MTSKERNPKVTHAGAVIFRGSGEGAEVLLTKMVGGRVPGFFLTQGHIEEGKTPEQAAQREIIEETSLQGAVLKKDLGILTRKGLAEDGQWYRKTIHFFLFRISKVKNSEWIFHSQDNKIFQLKFIPIKEIDSYLFFQEEKKLLKSVGRSYIVKAMH